MIEIHFASMLVGIFLGVLGTIAFTAIYIASDEDDEQQDDALG